MSRTHDKTSNNKFDVVMAWKSLGRRQDLNILIDIVVDAGKGAARSAAATEAQCAAQEAEDGTTERSKFGSLLFFPLLISDLPKSSGLLGPPKNAEVVLKAVPAKGRAQKPAEELGLGSEDLPEEIGEEGDYLKGRNIYLSNWRSWPSRISCISRLISVVSLSMDLPLETDRRHHRSCRFLRGCRQRGCSCPAVPPVVLHRLLLPLPTIHPEVPFPACPRLPLPILQRGFPCSPVLPKVLRRLLRLISHPESFHSSPLRLVRPVICPNSAPKTQATKHTPHPSPRGRFGRSSFLSKLDISCHFCHFSLRRL